MENFIIESFYNLKELDFKINISKIPNIENIFLLSFLNFYNEEIIKPKEIQIYKNELLINTFENIYLIENKNYQVFDKKKNILNIKIKN